MGFITNQFFWPFFQLLQSGLTTWAFFNQNVCLWGSLLFNQKFWSLFFQWYLFRKKKEFCYADFCPWEMMKHRDEKIMVMAILSTPVVHNSCTVSHLSSNNLGGRTYLARIWFRRHLWIFPQITTTMCCLLVFWWI